MNKNDDARFFASISLLFWIFVILMSLLWEPTYQLMKLIIRMHSEYSLVEQGSKFLLLVMMTNAALAYSNASEAKLVKIAVLYVLFALALYFAESNFILSEWQPVFGAAFIPAICWLLLRVNIVAMLLMVGGAGLIVLGTISDLLLDKPQLFPNWEILAHWQAIAGLIEEQFDLWGIACFSYSTLVAFRGMTGPIYRNDIPALAWLIASLVLIAAGNSFAHWQYHPSSTFELISTAMAVVGMLGVLRFDRAVIANGYCFVPFRRDTFYTFLVLAFIVLPIIYGDSGRPFNLLMWSACFYYLWRLMTGIATTQSAD